MSIIDERNSRINFVEETHTYFIDGSSKGVISVTTLIHEHFPKFNAKKVIQAMRDKPDFSQGKYAGMTDKYIINMWNIDAKVASTAGTSMHKNIERYYDGEEIPVDSVEIKYFLDFDESIKERLMPYRTEWSIFEEDIKLAGQLDILYSIEGTDKYALYDWKRSKELKMTNNFSKGLGCLSHLDDCNYIHYSIQLNIYKYILESRYGLIVAEMFLVVLHPNNDTYKLVKVNEMKEEVEMIFKHRKESL
jgi:hypothetical protein